MKFICILAFVTIIKRLIIRIIMMIITIALTIIVMKIATIKVMKKYINHNHKKIEKICLNTRTKVEI